MMTIPVIGNNHQFIKKLLEQMHFSDYLVNLDYNVDKKVAGK